MKFTDFQTRNGLILPIKPVPFSYPFFHICSQQSHHHRIGWWENLQESPIFDGKNHGFRLRFSLKPIQWHHTSWPCPSQAIGATSSACASRPSMTRSRRWTMATTCWTWSRWRPSRWGASPGSWGMMGFPGHWGVYNPWYWDVAEDVLWFFSKTDWRFRCLGQIRFFGALETCNIDQMHRVWIWGFGVQIYQGQIQSSVFFEFEGENMGKWK